MVMHGPMTGKIMVTRASRIPDAKPESIFVSVCVFLVPTFEFAVSTLPGHGQNL